MAVHPAIQDDTVLFVTLLLDGYHSAVERLDTVEFSRTSHDDYLAVTAANNEIWVEKTGHESTIVSTLEGRNDIRQAESPVTSFDGRWLAFLREDRGRTRVWVHALDQPGNADSPVTPPDLNVLEMSFLPKGRLYSPPPRAIGRAYSREIRQEISDLSELTRPGILLFLQMATGSHIAN